MFRRQNVTFFRVLTPRKFIMNINCRLFGKQAVMGPGPVFLAAASLTCRCSALVLPGR